MSRKYRVLTSLMLIATLLHTGQTFGSTSLGLGLQYGVVGAKFTDESRTANLSFSVGLLGAGAGFELPVSASRTVTAGANLGAGIIGTWAAASLNYHFSGFRESGWILGSDVGWYQNAWAEDDVEGSLLLSLNLGRRF